MKTHFKLITFYIIFLLLSPFLLIVRATEYEISGILLNEWEVPHVAEDGVYGVTGHGVTLYNSEGEQLAKGMTGAQASFSLTYASTSINSGERQGEPTEYKLGHPYPNPFNPKTTILFESPKNSGASISVYNILGQEVMHTRKNISRGTSEIEVNLKSELSQGLYFLRIKGDGFTKTEKMTFVSRGKSDGSAGITVRTASESGAENRLLSKQQATADEKYRLVFEETDIFHGKEIEIPASQDYEAGQVMVARKKSYWRGTITGQGIYKDNLEKFESGFTMEVVNLPVFVYEGINDKEFDIFNGWVRTQYTHPGWASLEVNYTRQFNVITPMNTGEIGGVLDWSAVGSGLEWDHGIYYRYDLRPTYSNQICAGGICTDPDTNETSILGFGGVYGSISSDFPFSPHAIQLDLVMDGDMIKVSLPEEYKETTTEYTGDDGETLTRTLQYSISGELYRVNWENQDLNEGDVIETDKYTRKKIDHTIENPDGGDPMEQFEMYLDAQSKIEALDVSSDNYSLEQIYGELRMKTKDLSPEQMEIRSPISVTGPRGTDYVMRVDDDSTTTVTVFEGEVEFSNRDGTGTVTVGTNEQSVIKPGEKPTEPETIEERAPISRWWETRY